MLALYFVSSLAFNEVIPMQFKKVQNVVSFLLPIITGHNNTNVRCFYNKITTTQKNQEQIQDMTNKSDYYENDYARLLLLNLII